MHGPINVKSPNDTSKWQMGFNSAFKGLNNDDNNDNDKNNNNSMTYMYVLTQQPEGQFKKRQKLSRIHISNT
jgi:hypothetical protein